MNIIEINTEWINTKRKKDTLLKEIKSMINIRSFIVFLFVQVKSAVRVTWSRIILDLIFTK